MGTTLSPLEEQQELWTAEPSPVPSPSALQLVFYSIITNTASILPPDLPSFKFLYFIQEKKELEKSLIRTK